MNYILYCVLVIACMGGSCKDKIAKPPAINKDNNSLLWRVADASGKQVSYLYGTFHLMCKEDIVIGNAVNEAIEKADEVYFELDLDDPGSMLGAMFFINMKNDSSLKQLLTEPEYDRVNDFFTDTIGSSLTMFQRMKPSLLEAFMYPKMLGCRSSSGVEQELLVKVNAAKKKVLGLETIEDQVSVFDKIPYAVQAKSLLNSIDSFATTKIKFAEMLQNYKSQRLDLLNDAVELDTEGLADYLDPLLYNRNRNWVKKLVPIFKEKNLFIAVGAGHLSGDQGLIDLLRKKGFTVEPVATN